MIVLEPAALRVRVLAAARATLELMSRDCDQYTGNDDPNHLHPR
jgi:hypothetical protein